jgi:hypothetical protein
MRWLDSLRRFLSGGDQPEVRPSVALPQVGDTVNQAVGCAGCGQKPMLTDLGDLGEGLHMQCVNPACRDPRFTRFIAGRDFAATLLEWNILQARNRVELMTNTGSRAQLRRTVGSRTFKDEERN